MSDPKLVFAITFTAVALLCTIGGVLTWFTIVKSLAKECRSEFGAFVVSLAFIPMLVFVFVGVGNLLMCIWHFTPERFLDGVVPFFCGVIPFVVSWKLFFIFHKSSR